MRIFEKIASFFDTDEEKAILVECEAEEPKLKHDFTVDVAVRNRMKAARFWLWAFLAAYGVRCALTFAALHKNAETAPHSAWIFLYLYGGLVAVTVLCLVGALALRHSAAKHYRLIGAVCDGYMLIYMLCSAAFTVLDYEDGVVGFALIVALFLSGCTLYYRPAVTLLNVTVTVAAFFAAAVYLNLQVFLQPLMLFRIGRVAVLSVIIGLARYRSKYKVFLREYSLKRTGEQLNSLNTELQENRVRIEKQNQQLQTLTNTDELTGLRSRRSFVRESAETLARAAEKGCFVTVAIADIDNFKAVNDTYGHTVGDACLRAVGEVFSSVETDGVCAYRLGGDELIAVFADKSRADAFLAMNRVAKAVSNLQIPQCAQPVTLSVGIHSAIPTKASHIDEYIEKADVLLYAAKASGRNQIFTTIKEKGDSNDVTN